MSCNQNITDIESLTQNLDKRIKNVHIVPDVGIMKNFVLDLITEVNEITKINKNMIDDISKKLKHKYRVAPSKPDIRTIYEKFYQNISIPIIMTNWMIKKSMRSASGVLVVTITLSPHKFSCKYDCFYCPQETDLNGVPTQPRSYLSSEPAMQRAINTRTDVNNYEFDVKNQFQNRVEAYLHQGNINKNDLNSHKMEIILSGGTWESYPKEYREQVIHELYYSANTMFDSISRDMMTLKEEQTYNETTKFRIIGLTVETRPDNITPENIQNYCRWGVTRIQIGVQHFDDAILRKLNRKCYTKDTKRAIRLLKQAGFKVVVHLMPDLPDSSPELDEWMFNEALTNPDLQFDDLKIYPTAICKSSDPDRIVYSKIGDWYKEGTYKPYAEKCLADLINVLISYKTRIQPWIRIQRLVRDIPGKSIESGYEKKSNLRQIIHDQMKKNGQKCNCIFCMEIGDKELDDLTPIMVVQKYNASEGIEYFLSIEAHNMNNYQKLMYDFYIIYIFIVWLFTGEKKYWSGNLNTYSGLYGFLRLRIDPNPGGDFISEINNCALIREVHVYGTSLGVGTESIGSQHRGFGKLLVNTAERIASSHNLSKSAVIAGIGTREYYKNKCGYYLGETYMLKNLSPYDYRIFDRTCCVISLICFYQLYNIIRHAFGYM